MAQGDGWARGEGNGGKICCERKPFGLDVLGSMLLNILGSVFSHG